MNRITVVDPGGVLHDRGGRFNDLRDVLRPWGAFYDHPRVVERTPRSYFVLCGPDPCALFGLFRFGGCGAGAGVGGWRGRSTRWVVLRALARWVRTLQERAPGPNPRDYADQAPDPGVMTVLQCATRAPLHTGVISPDSAPEVDSAYFQGKPGFGRVRPDGPCVQTRSSGSTRRPTRSTGPSPAGRQRAAHLIAGLRRRDRPPENVGNDDETPRPTGIGPPPNLPGEALPDSTPAPGHVSVRPTRTSQHAGDAALHLGADD
ncbi:Hypothetical protein ACGLYG10_1392 [Actinomyces glycerinitolerans]|uniref:Uncharacterized protein n=1 Tax=Actinomyces glycerinitolerans TaxID=1892869 RepID=A0A1M4RZM3_9ACTO|nr:Hypothetical protein ACGLYG10_1392 [Actinomyces glycerinitolerans]